MTRHTEPIPHAGEPVQLVLPRQEAAPEGPVDPFMMYAAHHAFRRDLAAFADAVEATPTGDRRTWAALLRRWDLFAEVLHHHHSTEDAALWPLLLERAAPEEQATLAAMEAEHEEIDPLLQACRAGFERLAHQPDQDARAALHVRVVAARESLGRHLAHEERDAMALVQRHLTPADWHRLEVEHFARGLGVPAQLRLAPWLLHGLPAAARRDVLRRAGRPVQVLWWLGRWRFERAEARAFRPRR